MRNLISGRLRGCKYIFFVQLLGFHYYYFSLSLTLFLGLMKKSTSTPPPLVYIHILYSQRLQSYIFTPAFPASLSTVTAVVVVMNCPKRFQRVRGGTTGDVIPFQTYPVTNLHVESLIKGHTTSTVCTCIYTQKLVTGWKDNLVGGGICGIMRRIYVYIQLQPETSSREVVAWRIQ